MILLPDSDDLPVDLFLPPLLSCPALSPTVGHI